MRDLPRRELLAVCAGFRIRADDDTLAGVSRLALRELAHRVGQLDDQLALVKTRLRWITTAVALELVAKPGVGPDTASTLLITAGDNPQRLTSERSFAALCGTNPIPASSGKTIRHRLNRGGDRQANSALWRITIVRLATPGPSRNYLNKHIANDKTKTEAIRCLMNRTGSGGGAEATGEWSSASTEEVSGGGCVSGRSGSRSTSSTGRRS